MPSAWLMLGLCLSLTIVDFARVVRFPKAVLVGLFAQTVVLVAIACLLALVTLPLIVDASLAHFLGQDQFVPPPTRKIVEVAAIIVVPVVLGMALRAGLPRLAAALERPIRVFAVPVLAAVIGAAVMAERERLPCFIAAVGAVCLAFNRVSMAVGYGLPRLLALPRGQAIAISVEIGIHNGTLAIFIALNVLQNGAMSVPADVLTRRHRR